MKLIILLESILTFKTTFQLAQNLEVAVREILDVLASVRLDSWSSALSTEFTPVHYAGPCGY